MGANSSKIEKALGDLPDDARYFGFENFGNTCYANSVLQSLYFCRPFRENLLQYAANLPKDAEDNLLTCLADLFVQVSTSGLMYTVLSISLHMFARKLPVSGLIQMHGMQIHNQKRKVGVIAPKRFVQRLKKDNELFRSYMHQVCTQTRC